MITNKQSGTNIHEIAEGIYRINTPIQLPVGAFSFNQYLFVDDKPMLFHTGPRRLFPLVQEAIAGVLPPEQLSYIGFSHFEADECGALNEFLAIAPDSVPVCGRVAALVSVNDVADRAPQALGDGDVLRLGHHALRWFDTPHLPHAWECGLMFDDTTRTLLGTVSPSVPVHGSRRSLAGVLPTDYRFRSLFRTTRRRWVSRAMRSCQTRSFVP